MGLIKKYFEWLQKDVPTGDVEKYPVIDENGETSVKGIYIVGDLTGIPLLKLAAESGTKIVEYLMSLQDFRKERENKSGNDIYDVVIIGAGPAGVAAGIKAQKYGLNFVILEASKKFNTIINFPKGKPIFAEPTDYEQHSDIKISDGIKESLLEELNRQLQNTQLPIEEGIKVDEIKKQGKYFEIISKDKSYKALRVIIATGKSGSSRKLKVPGEDLPKVFNRLFDPAEAEGHDVLVVGGGDNALETAIAVAEYAKSTTISYRKSSFSRPKQGNLEKLNRLVEEGKIKVLFETTVKEIREDSVILSGKDNKEIILPNSLVYVMIGNELPVDFFKRSGIKMEGELGTTSKLMFAALLLFSAIVYFGKSSAELYSYVFGKTGSFSAMFSSLFSVEFWGRFFSLPGKIFSILFSGEVHVWNVTKYINALIAYFAFILFVLMGIYLLVKFIKTNAKNIKFNWNTFKYLYFIFVAIFMPVVYFGEKYFGLSLFGKSQGFYYTGLYSLTILIFGLRRMKVRPTKYIIYQTTTLILIQIFPLFLLPEFILPYLGKIGALGSPDGFILQQVFPTGNWEGATPSYWRAYGFILAWPLNFANLYDGNITTFWFVFSIVQTFVIIPLIVYKWGKGAYCGWICSCGALAETLGDDYRTRALHGEKPKRWENIGQWILVAAFIVTGLKLIAVLYNIEIPVINEQVNYTADFLHVFYYLAIDIIFAGVLGLGVYFFLSGRVWCRFGCPLAALMHIYARFTKYRIFSEKKKCISCNICTKVCHMGIDVMNYANKGIPMNDVECVRCSACIVNCPTQVLSFGSLPKADPDNILYKDKSVQIHPAEDWKKGLQSFRRFRFSEFSACKNC